MLEKSPRNLGSRNGPEKMQDAALARSYISHIAGEKRESVGAMLERVYASMTKHYPKGWTRRRLRTLWHTETDNVKFREMVELHEVAARAVIERDRLRKARVEHDKFVKETARIAALVERRAKVAAGSLD